MKSDYKGLDTKVQCSKCLLSGNLTGVNEWAYYYKGSFITHTICKKCNYKVPIERFRVAIAVADIQSTPAGRLDGAASQWSNMETWAKFATAALDGMLAMSAHGHNIGLSREDLVKTTVTIADSLMTTYLERQSRPEPTSAPAPPVV